jgi:hypothetical protein
LLDIMQDKGWFPWAMEPATPTCTSVNP